MSEHIRTALQVMLGLGFALGLTVLVYWNGLTGSFILDDGANIVIAHIPGSDWDGFIYSITHNGSGLLGRSVSMVTFVLTGLQYGLDPWGYKYHNLLLHLLNGVLLFRFLQLLLPQLDHRQSARHVLAISGGAAAIWLLHPLLVSSVLYAVQRMTQLSAFFTLLALLAYLKARLNLESLWRYLLFGWVLFPLCALLAVLSKENGALLPFYVLLIEVCAFHCNVAAMRTSWRVSALVLIFGLIPIVLGLGALLINFESLINFNGRTFTLEERLLTQLHALFFYVRLILLPRVSAMSLFHDDFPVQTGFDAATLALLLFWITVVVLAWRLRSRSAVFSFGLFWFLVSHLLESTIFPLELVFEHRNYMAAVGLILPLVHAVFTIGFVAHVRFMVPVIMLVFAFLTATRASEWGDHELFTMIALTEHPGSGRAHNNYVNLLSTRRQYDRAVEQLEIMSTAQADTGVYLHKLLLKCGLQIRDDADLVLLEERLNSRPVSVYTLNGLQALINNVAEGRCKHVTLDELEQLVITALEFPMNLKHKAHHASLLRLRGIVAFSKGYYAQGYAWFMTAHEITPDTSLLHELLTYQINLGKTEDAVETLALVEQRNSERFGVDNWRVKQLRHRLRSATGS